MFHTILVPLDGSDFAEQALPWALCIARHAGATLDLVRGHVVYALQTPAAAWGSFDPTMEAESKQEEKLYLDATARWLSSVSPVPTATSLVSGFEAEGILEHISANRPDLIVMNTHGRGGIGRILLGSTADELIRHSEVPVLLTHPSEASASVRLIPEPVVKSVLVLLDGSSLAEQVLPPAADLARLMEAEMTLLRVVETSSAFAERDTAGAEAYLRQMAERLLEQGLLVRTRVVVARHVGEAIVEESRALKSDLIALATHGRGGLRRMLFGSIADQVIRGTACPALIYRPAAR